MKRSQAEFRLACFVADCLRRDCRPDVLWSHFPAGENRTAITGERLKRMGLKRGWPDYIFLEWRQPPSFLELKAARGNLSLEQRAFRDAVKSLGCRYAIARNGQQAIEILTEWGIMRRMRISA